MDVLSVCLLINSLLALCCFGVAFRILRTDCEKGKRPTCSQDHKMCFLYAALFSGRVEVRRSLQLCLWGRCFGSSSHQVHRRKRFIQLNNWLDYKYFHQPWLVGISRGSRGGASGLHDHPLLGRSLLHVLHLQRLPWLHVHLRPAKRRWRWGWTNRLLHPPTSRSRSEWCSVLWHALQQRASSQE